MNVIRIQLEKMSVDSMAFKYIYFNTYELNSPVNISGEQRVFRRQKK